MIYDRREELEKTSFLRPLVHSLNVIEHCSNPALGDRGHGMHPGPPDVQPRQRGALEGSRAGTAELGEHTCHFHSLAQRSRLLPRPAHLHPSMVGSLRAFHWPAE